MPASQIESRTARHSPLLLHTERERERDTGGTEKQESQTLNTILKYRNVLLGSIKMYLIDYFHPFFTDNLIEQH